MDQTTTRSASDIPFVTPDEQTGYVVVEASARQLAKLALQGLLFTALTLGLYRFWYMIRVRRYFWSHTRLGRYPFEFTGRPGELIVGFMMAVAILLPLYLGLFVVSLGLKHGVLIANLGALVLLWFLSQFGLYRARNYRLTRTVWRSLRFRQGGSGIWYAVLSIGWFILGIASFGLLWPLRRRALQAYKIRNTWFGTERASFDATILPLYRSGWPLVLGLCMIGLWIVWHVMDIWQSVPEAWTVRALIGTPLRDIPVAELFKSVSLADILWLAGTTGLALILVLAMAGPSYLAAETRHFTNATSFGPIRLKSGLTRQALLAVWGRYLLVLAAFSAAYLGAGAVLFGAFLYSDLPVGVLDGSMARFWFFAVLVLYYCAGFMGYAVIHLVVFRFPIWQTVGNSISLYPMQSVSAIRAGQFDAMRRRDGFGEGIADALDAGGI